MTGRLPGGFWQASPKSTRAVTVRGEVFHATGQVSAGKPARTAALGRPRQRRELQESLEDIERQIGKLDLELQKFTARLETAHSEVVELTEAADRQRLGLEISPKC